MGKILEWFGFGRPQAPAVPQDVVSPWADSSHLQAVAWAHLLDLPYEQAPVSRAQAMAVPAIARGRHTITGQIGRLPITTMHGTTAAPVQPRITRQPERGRSRFLTLAWTADSMLFYGRAWWVVMERYAEDNRPRSVQWVPEEAVRITLDAQGRESVEVYGQPIDPYNLLRLDGPHEGILVYGQDTLRAARALSRAAGRAADNPVPSVELHQTTTERLQDDEIRALVGQWAAARRGKDGGVAYTNAAIEARAMGQAPEQLLIEGRKAAALEAAQVMGLPAWAVDAETGGSSLTYSNVPSRSRELLDYTLAPYLEAIAGRLSMDDILARGVWARFSTESLTTPDFGQRMKDYKAAQEAGIYTIEECQALEQGTPLEGIDA